MGKGTKRGKTTAPAYRPSVTGQIVLRNQGDAPDGSGRRLFDFCGVLAVPDAMPIPSADFELQYTIAGDESGRLFIIFESGSQLPEPYRSIGYRLDQLLTAPIWRI